MDIDDKRRVGIATWYQYRNYGTALQAVSLSRVVRQMGYKAVVLRHDPDPVPEKDTAKTQLLNRLIAHLEWRRGYYSIKDERRDQLFDCFVSSSLEFYETPTPLRREDELWSGYFDAFVCGSDQIWSPRNYDSFYFLDFISDGSKKVAYAPSFGCEAITDRSIAESMGCLLEDFSSISVREDSGAKIVESLTGRHPQVVLDPTLLLSRGDLSSFANDNARRPSSYCLFYFLGHYSRNTEHAFACAKRLGLKAVLVPVFERDKREQNVLSTAIGPAEFVSLIKNAAYVFTDSFHGIALSVQLGVPFTCYERFKPSASSSQNTRVYNILNRLELGDCLITRRMLESGSTDMSVSEIDWKRIDATLNEEREKSRAFLRRALAKACGKAR